jgi:hypothetical protein
MQQPLSPQIAGLSQLPPGLQTPATQASPVVQALPSSQLVQSVLSA